MPRAASSTADSTVADVAKLDFGKVNPVTGPIFVEGAEPGDALKVTIEAFKPSGFGWTANIPGFGLLADQFKEPALNIWKYDAISLEPALYGKNARVPLKPFAGTIGNAPAESGLHSVVPPRRVGGNLDIRDLAAGTMLYLPVEVAGALFSVGDTHAAQGDGEVCGTAIESPMDVVLKLDLVKDARLKTPRFTTSGPVTRHLDAKGYEATTGIGPDLMAGRQERGRPDGRPHRQPATAWTRSTPICSLRCAATCASARSSTCRTGWCRSTSRAASSNDVQRPAPNGPGRQLRTRRRRTAGAGSRRPQRVRARRGRRARGRFRPLLQRWRAARRCASPANPAPASR